MIIYKDVLTGDELFSDVYKIKEIDDFFYEVEGADVCRTDTFDESKIGANPSAEEFIDGNDASIVSGCNIVLSHSLQEIAYNKKSYQEYIKAYMKGLKEHLTKNNPDRLEPFMSGAPAQVKKILGNFKEYKFYSGSSLNPDGMVGLLDYREDGTTPFMIFFKDGVELEKC